VSDPSDRRSVASPGTGERDAAGVESEGETTTGVAVDVLGGERHDVALADRATYGDLLRAVGLNPHEATALVESRPVPEDERVPGDVGRVEVLRLVQGG